MHKALLIIAKHRFQDVELAGTRKGLIDAGYHITLGSTEIGECVGKFDSIENADIALKDIDVSEYDIIAFIGGPGAAALANDLEALRVAHDAFKAEDIVLGAICIAPTILAKAGILKGKKATVWDEGGAQAKLLIEHGAICTGESVTIDGKIITGNGPEAAEEFGRKLASLSLP